MHAHAELVEQGMERPSIRAVLYKLLSLPGWDKKHYDTLCVKLGEWRDEGLIPFGVFSDGGAGEELTPRTTREIAELIAALKDSAPAQLGTDGRLHGILVEHVGLVNDIARWLDYQCPVVSCQGQLRREILHTAMTKWQKVTEELGGKGVSIIALVDYDKGGRDIHGAVARWLQSQFGLTMRLWGVTEGQVKEAGLNLNDNHQIDGWMAAYGPRKVRIELRRAMGLGG
jgi:hypothetical protein